MKRFSCRVTAVLTAAFFISSGTFVPSSFAELAELTLNEAQQFVPTVTLEQASSKTATTPDIIPSGAAIQNSNSLSIPDDLPRDNGPQTTAQIFDVYEGDSIQDAIDQAQAGDTVYLHAGTYREQVVLKQGVDLEGEDSETTVIDGGYDPGVPVVRALGNNRIENLTVIGAKDMQGQLSSAIRIEGDHVTVRDNKILFNLSAGVYVQADVAHVLIERNLFHGNSIAIKEPKSGNEIRYNTITGYTTEPAPRVTSIHYLSNRGFQLGMAYSEGIYSYHMQYTDDGGQTWKFAREEVSPGVFEDKIVLANRSGATSWIDDGSTTSPGPFGVTMRWYRAVVAESFMSGIGIEILDGEAPVIHGNIIAHQSVQSIWEETATPSTGASVVERNVLFHNAEAGNVSGQHLPPAISPKIGEGWTGGNILADPQFTDLANDDYSVPETSPAFGRGAFLPEVLKFALDRAFSVTEGHAGVTHTIEEIRLGQELTGWRFVYSEGSVETFYKDGTKQLDTTPPVIVILSTTTLTNQASYTFRYTIDSVEHIETRTLREGQNTLIVQSSDIFGNTAVQNFNVMLDAVPPTGAVVINDNNAYTNTTSVTLTLNASDVTSGLDQMRFSTDGGATWGTWEAFVAVKSISLPPGDGIKTIQCQVKDRAGFISTAFEDAITLDQTPPAALEGGDEFSFLKSVSSPAPTATAYLGKSVVGVGQNVLVGADLASSGGMSNAGRAYLLDGNPGSATFGNILLELQNPTPGANDHFGTEVEVLGNDYLLVSATGDRTSGEFNTGSVYVFDGNPERATYGQLILTLRAPTSSSSYSFGTSIEIVGGNIAVTDSSKHVYLFNGNTSSLSFGNLLYTFSDPESGYGPGRSLKAVGKNLLVGGGTEFDTYERAGKAYLFDADPESATFGTLLYTFRDPTPNTYDYFGFSLEAIGTNIIIGGWYVHDGEIYMFDGDKNSPTFGNLIRTFYSPEPSPSNKYFGCSLAVDAGLKQMVVGSMGSGKAFVFNADRDSTNFGALLGTLSNPSPVYGDTFGDQVAVASGTIWVLDSGKDVGGVTDAGILHAYDGSSAVPPVTINGGAAYTTSASINLTLSVLDTVSGLDQMRFSTDGGLTWTAWENYATSKSLVLQGTDGQRTVTCQVKDKAGNIAVFLDDILLNQSGFFGAIAISNGASYVKTADVILNLNIDGAVLGVDQMRFSTDDGVTWTDWENFAVTKSLTFSGADGSKTVQCQVKNSADRSANFSDMIILDRIAPTGSILINNDAVYAITASATLTLTASDTTSGLDQMRFTMDDGVTWTAWESFVATKSLAFSGSEGTRKIQCQVRDKAGNAAAFVDTVIWDRTAPSGTVSINDGASYAADTLVTVSLAVSDFVSGLDQMRFSTNTGSTWSAWEAYASTKAVTLSAGDGIKWVDVEIKDRAGNIRKLYDLITLDIVGPTGSVVINGNMVYASSPSVTLSLSGSDLASGVDKMSFSIDGGVTWSDWESFAVSKTLSLSPGDGEKEVRVRLKDRAGNISGLISDSIILDSAIRILDDQNFSTLEEIRKTMVLGPLLDSNNELLIYSFSASANLLLNGQFSLLKNQLTYVPNKGFTGSGVIMVQASDGVNITQHNVNLQVTAPQINTSNDPSLSYQYGLSVTDAIRAWNFSRGAGIDVAILDTGINMTHPDLDANIFTNPGEIAGDGIDNDGNGFVDDVHGWDFENGNNDTSDFDGHGTHVAGIIGAERNNLAGGSGIAPDVDLLPIQFVDEETTDINRAWQNVASAINYAVALGVRVVNMSIGWLTSGLSATVVQALRNAINAAHAAGVVVVASAGNDYANANNYTPAAFDHVITVSATNSSDLRATYDGSYFSNYGSAVDFAAPGANIYSTYLSSYDYGYGTSMSAPFVAGLAAMLLSQDPTATPDDVYRRLKYSSKDLGTSGWDQYYGYGRIDAFRALSYDYYDNGTIKTQWLEAADENGWNRLFFDTDGYLTGGSFVAAAGLSGLGAALADAITPASQRMASLSVPSFAEFGLKQPLKFRGADLWGSWTRDQPRKVEKADDSETLEPPLLLPADKKKSAEPRKITVKGRKKNSSQEHLSDRSNAQGQKMIHDLARKELILKGVWGSPITGTVFCLLDAEPAAG